MLDLDNDHHRLRLIRKACEDIRAGRAFDPILQAELIRPWLAMFRLVVEQPAVNRIELFETCAARLARKIAGAERATDRPFGGHRSTPPEKKSAARKAEKPKAKPPAPPAPDCTGDVI